MKKVLLTAIAVFVSSFAVLMAKEDNKIVCEGTYNRHLQGVATDGSNIWWSFTDEIVRTDKKGKVLKSVKAVSHQGDCCYVNGKLYVAVNLGKFNTEDKADSWVYCFDGNTLELENKWKVPELVHGAGGMTFANGDFYVVGGLPPDHTCNYVYRYSTDFKFKQRYVLKTGYTGLGIQTAAFEDGKFYFGCYSGKDHLGNKVDSCTLVCPADLSSFRRSKLSTSVGMVKLDGKYMVAVAKKVPGKDESNPKAGTQIGILIPSDIKIEPLRILAIGNSFTISLMNHNFFPEAIKSAGENIEIAVMYIGGCPLERHWKNIEKADDENFKPYVIAHNIGDKKRYNANIPQMLKAAEWDIVTIQQVSHMSFKPETYEPYTTKIVDTIRKACPRAQIVFQQTWAYTTVGNRIQSVGAVSQELMYENLTKAYKGASQAHGLDIIPTGLAVQLARKALNVKVPEVPQKERAKFVYPDTPNVGNDIVGKFYWGKSKKDPDKKVLHCDEIHLNQKGEYLQACTWLKYFCPEVDIVNLPYYPQKILSAEEAKILRTAACEAVKQGL
jgi:hypothetical protein